MIIYEMINNEPILTEFGYYATILNMYDKTEFGNIMVKRNDVLKNLIHCHIKLNTLLKSKYESLCWMKKNNYDILYDLKKCL